MATSQEFHDYVMDRLSLVGDFYSIRMMGEYCIYMEDKVIGLLCDDMLLLKPTESVLKLMPNAERKYPYEGSKTLMVIVEDLEDADLLAKTTDAMYDELPAPKEKKRKLKKTNDGFDKIRKAMTGKDERDVGKGSADRRDTSRA